MSFEFRAAMRSLLLPIAPAKGEEFFACADESLTAAGVGEDKAAWLSLQLRRWKNDGAPSIQFRAFVSSLLFSAKRDPKTFVFESLGGPNADRYLEAAKRLGEQFFRIHSVLVSQHLLSHHAARQVLSHAGMLLRFAIEEHMTASEIARLLAAKDRRFALNWRVVRAILQKTGQAPSLSLETVGGLFENDGKAEGQLLGDLNVQQSIERIASIADMLGCEGDFGVWLGDLFLEDLHHPYLLLLHYQLLIQAEFDHAVTYAYEFEPRGARAAWLRDRYIEAGLPVAKSAFLNNAKATLKFDQSWVAGRTDHLRSATALANTLGAMENLATQAKNELASQIRGLLHRVIRRSQEEHQGQLPHLLAAQGPEPTAALLNGIGDGNTNTTGILEQRLVDCLGAKRHAQTDGWAPKGMGDSVFAANTFRRKFGDIEFEFADRQAPQIRAYESHGGRLTAPYVDDHLDSFRSVLGARIDDLIAIAPLEEWTFHLTFVAHEIAEGLPDHEVLDGANTQLTYMTFKEAAAEIDAAVDADLIASLMIDRLNDGFVPPAVREKANNLMVP